MSAQGGSREPTPEEKERRLEALEASIRGKKAPKPPQIRNQQPKEDVASEMSPWEEGKLFPEGWENMDFNQKALELWMGRRGFLFWSNKIAYGAAITLVVAWIVFRFIGPNLGLYKLAGDPMPPPV